MSFLPLPPAVRLLLPGLCLIGALPACRKPADSVGPAAPASGTAAVAAAAPADAGAPAEVRKMLGRWLRSDGTYELELKGADKTGVVEAAYFNPKSIHVSRSIWMRGAEGLQIVVELNDVGYPGATYVLSHDPKEDRLFGKYNQPQMGQTFEVDFVRKKASPLR